MIRFEINEFPFALTNDQFSTIAGIIQHGPSRDYDIVEGDTDGIVWLWVHYGEAAGMTPSRYWIEVDGTVSLIEDVDWDWNDKGVGAPTPTTNDKEGAVSAEQYKAVAERITETRAALDQAVYAALDLTPAAAIAICSMVGLDWGNDAGELRGSFLRLQAEGKATLTYGQGWAKVATQ